MAMVIHPNTGAGGVALGMSKPEVEQALGAPSREFVRNQFSVGPEWEYRGRGIIVGFNAKGACETLQLATPCDPVLRGIHLLGMGATSAMAALRRLDPTAALHGDTLISSSLGVSIFAPEVDNHPEVPASGVLVFGPGYYKGTDGTGGGIPDPRM